MKADATDPDLPARVQAVVDLHVLPYVRNHGGDVEVVAIDDDGTVATVQPGAIVLRDVHFSYPGNTSAALSGLSLRIEPGTTLGLVIFARFRARLVYWL